MGGAGLVGIWGLGFGGMWWVVLIGVAFAAGWWGGWDVGDPPPPPPPPPAVREGVWFSRKGSVWVVVCLFVEMTGFWRYRYESGCRGDDSGWSSLSWFLWIGLGSVGGGW